MKGSGGRVNAIGSTGFDEGGGEQEGVRARALFGVGHPRHELTTHLLEIIIPVDTRPGYVLDTGMAV